MRQEFCEGRNSRRSLNYGGKIEVVHSIVNQAVLKSQAHDLASLLVCVAVLQVAALLDGLCHMVQAN